MKESEFLASIKSFRVLDNAIREFGEDYLRAYFTDNRYYLEFYELYDDTIELHGREDSHCSCCSDDVDEVRVPLSYLYTDWQFELDKQRGEIWAREIEEKLAADERREKAALEKRRQNYERLKKEFEREQ